MPTGTRIAGALLGMTLLGDGSRPQATARKSFGAKCAPPAFLMPGLAEGTVALQMQQV